MADLSGHRARDIGLSRRVMAALEPILGGGK